MAKYYQHLLPGDNLGNVTTLKYIDDVSDDDIILYRFADGTACNKMFIAEAGNDNAFNGKYVMAELYTESAKWKFESHEVTLGENKTYTDPETGLTYDIPVPGVQKNGEYGGAFGDCKATAKDGQVRTTATPPVFLGKKEVEPEEGYVLSQHPELEFGESVNQPKETNEVKEPEHVLSTQVEDFPNESVLIKADSITISKDSSLYVTKGPDCDMSSFISQDAYISAQYMTSNNVQFTDLDGTVYKFTKEEFFDRLRKKDNTENANVCSTDITFIKEYLDKEDVLITNMIEKSKKVNSDIGMDLTLSLPPKAVYDTIKNVYPEEMTANFIKSLAYRISVKCLVDAIAEGLSVYYDGEKIAASTEA